MEKNEIQKVESPLASAAALVTKDGNMDVAKLKELLEMQERWDATQAKKAYVVAMAKFKENPPEILKDKHVKYRTAKGVTEYDHATLYKVTTSINGELSKHGLTASWQMAQDNGSIKVTCKITHVMGHSEETSLSAPPDASGNKNPIQAIASTVTYLQRYTVFALTGIAGKDQDDDGRSAGEGKQSEPDSPPKLTAENNAALSAIYEKLLEHLPKGKIPDMDKVAGIFLGQRGAYPQIVSQAGTSASWLLSLKQNDSWLQEQPKLTLEDSIADVVFHGYCKYYADQVPEGQVISREVFDSLIEGCKNSDGESPLDFAKKYVPFNKTLLRNK